MITITIGTDNAAWLDGAPELELEHVLAQVTDNALVRPCGPNGWKRVLRDSNGNATGTLVVQL